MIYEITQYDKNGQSLPYNPENINDFEAVNVGYELVWDAALFSILILDYIC
jgi:hypothetical protein